MPSNRKILKKYLCNVPTLPSGRDVVDALRRRDCEPALAWCAKHSARLRRVKSRLEFRLRVAEFVELIRARQGGRRRALYYSFTPSRLSFP